MPHVAPGWLSIYDPQPRAHYEIPLSSHFTGTPEWRVSAPPPRHQLQDFCITLRHGVFFVCFAGRVSPALTQQCFFFIIIIILYLFVCFSVWDFSGDVLKKNQPMISEKKIKPNPVSRSKLRNGLLEPICPCHCARQLHNLGGLTRTLLFLPIPRTVRT